MSRTGSTVRPLVLAISLFAPAVFAGFSGTDVFLPSVGRAQGIATWYTTVWVHNTDNAPALVQFYFLPRDQDNTSASPITLTIQGGDTARFGNALTELFGREGFGAIRITSSAKLLVGSRIYSKGAGDGERDSKGQDYNGIPASFAIGDGQVSHLLGVYQVQPSASSEYRFNYGFVETTGNACTVKVTPLDTTGMVMAAAKGYTVRGFEQKQYQLKDEFPTVSTLNARLEVEVTSGGGRVLAFGSGIANGSQDPTTFEMSFAESLLAENGSGSGTITGVTAGNGLSGGGTSGNVTLAVGAGEGITVGGDSVGIANNGVTAGKIAAGQVVKSLNGLKDGVTLAPGANITLTPSGNTLTIAATGGGSGGSGVPSVNGITSAVTIAGTGTASVSTVGGTVTVNGSGLSAVTPGTGLTGGGTPGSPLGIANGGVGTNQLADWAVTKSRLSAVGGSAGQVLGTDGSQLVWSSPGGLQLPYEGQGYGSGPAFKVISNNGWGVAGYTSGGTGIYGDNSNSNSVGHAGYFNGRVHVTQDLVVDGSVSGRAGSTAQDPGVFGAAETSGARGVYGWHSVWNSWSGFFNQSVYVAENLSAGRLYVTGTKDFRIDHPLDPTNRYLQHAAIESSEVLDVYSGNVVTGDDGVAVVEFPTWFEALNTDFRYQLTCIGRFAQAIVEQEVEGNRFTIRTNLGNVKVSWQVTARRNDAWMKAHPFEVEPDKPADERGTYLSPLEWGQGEELGAQWETIRHGRERARRLAEEAATTPR